MREEDPELPQPTLKAQLTKAPYWLSLRTTLEPVSSVMHCWKFCVRCQRCQTGRYDAKGSGEPT